MLDLLQSVPWTAVKRVRDWIRSRYATAPWPQRVDSVYVDLGAEEFQARLENRYWEDASPYSLQYDGEVLNLRRPNGFSDEFGHYRELHLRARETPDGLLECNAHEEPNRYLEKTAHVNETGLEWLNQSELEALLS